MDQNNSSRVSKRPRLQAVASGSGTQSSTAGPSGTAMSKANETNPAATVRDENDKVEKVKTDLKDDLLRFQSALKDKKIDLVDISSALKKLDEGRRPYTMRVDDTDETFAEKLKLESDSLKRLAMSSYPIESSADAMSYLEAFRIFAEDLQGVPLVSGSFSHLKEELSQEIFDDPLSIWRKHGERGKGYHERMHRMLKKYTDRIPSVKRDLTLVHDDLDPEGEGRAMRTMSEITEKLEKYVRTLEEENNHIWDISPALEALNTEYKKHPKKFKPYVRETQDAFQRRIKDQTEQLKRKILRTDGNPSTESDVTLAHGHLDPDEGAQARKTMSEITEDLKSYIGILEEGNNHTWDIKPALHALETEYSKHPKKFRPYVRETLGRFERRMKAQTEQLKDKILQSSKPDEGVSTRRDIEDGLFGHLAKLLVTEGSTIQENGILDAITELKDDYKQYPDAFRKGETESETDFEASKGERLGMFTGFVGNLPARNSQPDPDVQTTVKSMVKTLFQEYTKLSFDTPMPKDWFHHTILGIGSESRSFPDIYKKHGGQTEAEFDSYIDSKLAGLSATLKMLKSQEKSVG